MALTSKTTLFRNVIPTKALNYMGRAETISCKVKATCFYLQINFSFLELDNECVGVGD